MVELKSCKKCGGEAEFIIEHIETDFGDSRCVAVKCKKCKSRTSLYMWQGASGVIATIVDLWNRGCVGGVEDGNT